MYHLVPPIVSNAVCGVCGEGAGGGRVRGRRARTEWMGMDGMDVNGREE